MMSTEVNNPPWYLDLLTRAYHASERVEVGEWQSQATTDNHPMAVSYELMNEVLKLPVPNLGVDCLQRTINEFGCNMPWAEDHFRERVGGEPLNPPPSEAYWPFAQRGNADHKTPFDGLAKFSHTYPERFWPKRANVKSSRGVSNRGIRYSLGDLDDLVELLVNNPSTRQAYLPIFFPEDTGAVEGQRVPCTLGYQIIIRDYKATIVYFMRSCDIMRHLKDDAYMAARLLQFIVGKLQGRGIAVKAYRLHMHMTSLHHFEGDRLPIKKLIDQWKDDNHEQLGFGI